IVVALLLMLSYQCIFSQTKEETIDWLNEMMDEYTKPYPLGKFSISIYNDPNYGEMIIIKKYIYILTGTTKYYSFLPQTIKDVKVTSKYRTTSDFKDIEFVSKGTTIYDLQTKELKKYVEILWDGPLEELYRVQKGIIHLLELMGNKIEDRDLFKN